MAAYTTLKSLFAAIADAIRSKDGSLDAIVAYSFPERIAALEAQNSEAEDGIINGTLATYSNDRVSEVRNYCFHTMLNLVQVDLPNAKNIRGLAFADCRSLKRVCLESCQSLDDSSFAGCMNLSELIAPLLAKMGSRCLSGTYIEILDIAGCTSKGEGVFGSESFSNMPLHTLVIRHPYDVGIPRLVNVNAFSNTRIDSGTGYIYVPRALIEEYKAAENWSTYASQFRALEDYTVDGTTTGDLDESKI